LLLLDNLSHFFDGYFIFPRQFLSPEFSPSLTAADVIDAIILQAFRVYSGRTGVTAYMLDNVAIRPDDQRPAKAGDDADKEDQQSSE